VIAFGLRLTLRGGRESLVRLVVTAGAVAIGVALLLLTLAGINGVHRQNARYAWLNSGAAEAVAGERPSPDPILGRLDFDKYEGATITRVDIAATGPRAPIPPGIPRLPGPGEYYASPALATLIREAPAAELGDRFPGRRIGTIGKPALPAPDSLIVIVGRTVADLSHGPRTARISAIATRSPDQCPDCRVGTSSSGMVLILSVISAALLFPVLIFIGTATRLSAARREQRFAAMRLVGATPRQITTISAVESGVAAIAGTALGFALFYAFRVPLAGLPYTGDRFYPSDLSLTTANVLMVALGVPLAAAVVARLALRRVRISPLGVNRRVTPRPPRAYRLLPLLAGVAELGYFVGRRPATTNGQTWAYLSGVFLMTGGLVIAGPWLTMVGARLLALRTDRPATLIAARRLGDDPTSSFRAISGLVLALFVGTTAIAVITTMNAERGAAPTQPEAKTTLTADFTYGRPSADTPGYLPKIDNSVLARLRAVPGVRDVLPLHHDPYDTKFRTAGEDWFGMWLVSCDEFRVVSGFGHCAPGAEVATVPPAFLDPRPDVNWDSAVWPAAPASPRQLRALPVEALAVPTAGPYVERVRTALVLAFPDQEPPSTVAESVTDKDSVRLLAGYQRLADVVILVSLCIAGCSLAVSVIAGLNDRKRPFSLLRLAGVPLRTLRRIVLLESAVPLCAVSAVAIGAGFLAAHLFLKSQMSYTLRFPGPEFYLTVLAGLLASLGVIAATLPILRRITGPETARNE
jgi:cell division protein FtsX